MAQSLRDLVVLMAKQATFANRETLYRALAASQVAVPLRNPPPGLRRERQCVSRANQFTVPMTNWPDGTRMLMVYTDRDAALQVIPPAKAGFEIAGKVVLQMAQAQGAGVIVSTGVGGGASWVAVPKEHVAGILSRWK
jgi:hypothetical protein